jgi:shikimate dehydrogenase
MRGVNVTIPHKVQVMQYVDRITPEAELIGAVNTIVNENGVLIGHNTDGSGYVRSLVEETHISIPGTTALILGAGGAARAVCAALALNGVKELYIMNRTPQKSADLADRVSRLCPARAVTEAEVTDIIENVSLIVNTTSLGMHPAVNDSPFDGELLRSGMVVSDLIYNPRETLLLQLAKHKGAVAHGGLGMFVYQGAQAFTLWTGVDAPVQTMRKAAESML